MGIKDRRRAGGARDLVLFAMLGTLLFLGDMLMEWAPNIHFVGALTVTYTVVYRVRALIPIYIYVFLNGLYAAFGLWVIPSWWIPYLYVWTVLWGATMLLPRRMPKTLAVPVYMVVCGLHGLIFGTLCAPVQALFWGLDLQKTLAWIAIGFPFDVIHAVGNLATGVLIVPLSGLLMRLERSRNLR